MLSFEFLEKEFVDCDYIRVKDTKRAKKNAQLNKKLMRFTHSPICLPNVGKT
jgi:hypothetical protein